MNKDYEQTYADPTLWRVICPLCKKKITVSEKTQKLRHHTGIARSPDGSRFRLACEGSGMSVYDLPEETR
jgi:hypothetical protein